ncbi:MAG: TonB-dependent receptor, partial [Gammaproteobacteria bacterium]
RSYGGALQTTLLLPVLGLDNQFILGASYNQGSADFNSQVEIARLLRDRSTSRTGLFVPDEASAVRGRTRTWSIYLTDTVSLTSKLALTFSGRYNATRVRITDLSGDEPDLNGQHDFQRFNPAFGVTYQWRPGLGIYTSYSESARAPTPVESSCADPDAPCNLPNSFLADPPLEQVVAKGFEGGLRGRLQEFLGLDLGATEWSLGGFHITNRNDILFQSTGGISSNEGFFANVGDTRRLGAELGLNGEKGPTSWFLNYSYVDARFQDPFLVSSPNHPSADDEGQTAVEDGDRIPSIPRHSVKVGAYIAVTPRLRLGGDLLYASGQYLRGDEANLLDTIDGYATVNVRGEYRINQHLALFAEVENLFDTDYETFGLLGEPEEILGPAFDDPRFLGPGAPIAGWFGVKISL